MRPPTEQAATPLPRRVAAVFLAACLATAQANAFEQDLRFPPERHLTFRGIAANRYHATASTLKIEVDRSASFVFYPFDRIQPVDTVRFEWKKTGTLRVIDAAHEASKAGDDAVLRIGLMLAGPADDFPNPLAPQWMRQLKRALAFPSAAMDYLIVDARHPDDAIWSSPYSDHVTMIAAPSQPLDSQWQRAGYTFTSPRQVVGLWIMADGDNTASTFTVWLRRLTLHAPPQAGHTE